MREGSSRLQARNIGNCRVRSDIKENLVGREHTRSSVVQFHLKRFWRYKKSAAHHQFGATRPVGAVVTLSFRIGPAESGVLAVFPVIYTSIMFILHCRVGGPVTAAVLANAVAGLAGFGVALLTLHLTVVPLGSATALVFALGVSVAWNAAVYVTRRHQVANEVIE